MKKDTFVEKLSMTDIPLLHWVNLFSLTQDMLAL